MARTVLVVDQDASSLQRIKAILNGHYRVWSYPQADGALYAVQNGLTPQVVLASVQLKGLGALEFKTRVRSYPRLINVPVVFLVPYKQGKLFKMVMPREHHLLKPFGDLELLDLLDRLFGTKTGW